MKWTNNNRACLTTWTTLRVLNQLARDQDFAHAGAKTMKDLTFFFTLSEESLEPAAKALAIQVDNVFRDIRGAEYEPGFDPDNAVKKIVAILTNDKATVAQLADAIDDAYHFRGESDEASR